LGLKNRTEPDLKTLEKGALTFFFSMFVFREMAQGRHTAPSLG
jgi:hypothetical protein